MKVSVLPLQVVAREKVTKRETPSLALGLYNFTKAIFRPIKRLKLIVS